MHTVPHDTVVYGAEFEAVAYAEGSGFTVNGWVATREDIPFVEYHLSSDGTRYYWKRMRPSS